MRTKEVVEAIRVVEAGFERGEGKVLDGGSERACWVEGGCEVG